MSFKVFKFIVFKFIAGRDCCEFIGNSYSQVHQSVVLQFAFTDKCYMLRKPSRCFFMKKTAMIFALRLECRQIRLLATASLGDDSNAKTFVRRPRGMVVSCGRSFSDFVGQGRQTRATETQSRRHRSRFQASVF